MGHRQAVPRTVIIFIVMAVIAGCGSTYYPTNSLGEGDSRDDVLRIMGNPSRTFLMDGREFLVYDLSSSMSESVFGKNAPYLGIAPLTRTGNEYYVVLENGKVIGYGDADNYRNLYKIEGDL